MRKNLLNLFCFILMLLPHFIMAQTNLSGLYQVDGYIFHPTNSRGLSLQKTITQIGPNQYQADIADLPGYSFQFDVDENNNIVNWIPLYQTTTLGDNASGFMTVDNPGAFTYPTTKQPGDSPWVQSVYNNTYDPVTKTFYMHYGYSTSSHIGQNGYERQVYEKWTLTSPAPTMSLFTPQSGTSGTAVTIKGSGFVTTSFVSFGNRQVDTFTVISDSEINAVLGAGASGDVKVLAKSGSVTLPGFTYMPPVVTNTGWVSAGNPDFSPGAARQASIAISSDNKLYVVYSDSVNGYRARVMRLNESNTWVNMGSFVSDGACSYPNIALDNNNQIYISYIDSLNSNNITVKTFKKSLWQTVGNAGFAAYQSEFPFNTSSLALDGNNIPYVISSLTATFGFYAISVMRFDGTSWEVVGGSDIGSASLEGDASLAIDKKTNKIYVITDDTAVYQVNSYYPLAIIKQYANNQWTTIGQPGFAPATLGDFFYDIVIDSSGTPFVSLQEDNGRSQLSVYKYNGNIWTTVGPGLFSPGFASFSSVTLDANGSPIIFFNDGTYNDQGSVMHYNNGWSFTGARGFAPGNVFTPKSIVVDRSNVPYIVFADKVNGNKIKVMRPESVLPVQLTQFIAELQNTNVLLNWQTVSENNTAYFNIQRSADGINFHNIYSLPAKGYSNITNNYSYTDINIFKLLNINAVYYRLQTTDKDNHSLYSSIVQIKLNEKSGISLSPNPVNNLLNIKGLDATKKYQVKIVNVKGNIVAQNDINNVNFYSWNIKNISKGIYYLIILPDDHLITTLKFIKQ